MQSIKVDSSHALFLKKLLEDVLQENKAANWEREKHGVQEPKPAQEKVKGGFKVTVLQQAQKAWNRHITREEEPEGSQEKENGPV